MASIDYARDTVVVLTVFLLHGCLPARLVNLYQSFAARLLSTTLFLPPWHLLPGSYIFWQNRSFHGKMGSIGLENFTPRKRKVNKRFPNWLSKAVACSMPCVYARFEPKNPTQLEHCCEIQICPGVSKLANPVSGLRNFSPSQAKVLGGYLQPGRSRMDEIQPGQELSLAGYLGELLHYVGVHPSNQADGAAAEANKAGLEQVVEWTGSGEAVMLTALPPDVFSAVRVSQSCDATWQAGQAFP